MPRFWSSCEEPTLKALTIIARGKSRVIGTPPRDRLPSQANPEGVLQSPHLRLQATNVSRLQRFPLALALANAPPSRALPSHRADHLRRFYLWDRSTPATDLRRGRNKGALVEMNPFAGRNAMQAARHVRGVTPAAPPIVAVPSHGRYACSTNHLRHCDLRNRSTGTINAKAMALQKKAYFSKRTHLQVPLQSRWLPAYGERHPPQNRSTQDRGRSIPPDALRR